ncbi:MAG: MFS transporter, partial [Nocardioidaceae bacterium]
VIVTFGWRAAFAVLAAAGLIWVVVWLFIGREGPYTSYRASMSGDANAAAPGADGRGEPRVPYRRILTTGTWLGATLGGHMAYWAIAIFAAWFPSYLEQGLGYSKVTAGSLVIVPALVGFVAMVAGGAVCRVLLSRGVSTRWACGAVESAFVIIAGVALLVLVVYTPPSSAQVVLLAAGFGLPFGAMSLTAMPVAEISPVRQRAAVISFSVIGMTIAGIFAPTVAGVLIGAAGTAPLVGYHHMMLLLGLLLLVGGIVAALIIRPRRDADRLGLPTSGREASPASARQVTGSAAAETYQHEQEQPK